MTRPRLVQFIALLGSGLLVWAAATRIGSINEGRARINAKWKSESPLEHAPPEYAFAIQAFGAFRGLITDIAFIRHESLKEQGRFYDAAQLAEFIATLQPHFPSVWEFLAWNMSWNISVTTYTPEERWRWVYNGVKLLRDKGIQLNPKSVNLYKQLGWTFNNKMSETTDEMHYAYKCEWAWRMHLVLGPPPTPFAEKDLSRLMEDVRDTQELDALLLSGDMTQQQQIEARRRKAEAAGLDYATYYRMLYGVDPPGEEFGAVTERPVLSRFLAAQAAAKAYMHEIAAAPATLAELYAAQPETRGMVSQLHRLGIKLDDDKLSEDSYWCEGGLAFSFFKPYREVTAGGTQWAGGSSHGDPEAAARLDEVLGVRKRDEAGEALVRFLQRKVLREVYKLDPEHMEYLVGVFGPMDWRSVDAHSLYWLSRGLIAGGETVQDFKHDKTNTARMIFFSLRNLFLRNRITFEPTPDRIAESYLSLSVDVNFIQPMHEAYVRYGPRFDPNPGEAVGAGSTFRAGHINFLTEAVRMLYLSGLEQEARYYFDYLRATYTLNPAGATNVAFLVPLHEFVTNSFVESLQSAGPREIMVVIDAMLFNAFNALADGDWREYRRHVETARWYHREFMKRQDVISRRQWLRDLGDLQIDALGGILSTPSASPLGTMRKGRLWRNTPLFLRQAVYDRTLPQLTEECAYWALDTQRVFPEPRGMEEYRRAHPERSVETQKEAEERGKLPVEAPR